jgi:Glycosyltransferase family 10 (fucosyltransferase) C-term
MNFIKIATEGVPHDYRSSLLPIVIQSMGYRIDWVNSEEADLLILGPFYKKNQKPYRWCPKPLRPILSNSIETLSRKRKQAPVTLFHTQENARHDYVDADYSISFDLGVQSERHFRFPYWMEMLDWSHEGLVGNINPRYGELLNISTLMTPLGSQYLNRGGSCALLSSHLREPRGSLFKALEKVVSTQGFGAFFNKKIKDHHSSGFLKKDILKDFSYNLCPENGLYPGYYTEKIPEAFYSGCLPITWADENISVDFNPSSLINLQPLFKNDFRELAEILLSKKRLETYQSEPLILVRPSLEPLKQFLSKLLRVSTSN